MSNPIELIPVKGLPLIKRGDDITSLILDQIDKTSLSLEKNDILIITHSIISIAEGSVYHLEEIETSELARKISTKTGQKPERIEVAIRESREIVRESPVFITKTKQGIITDYSGIDASNAPQGTLIALPENPDISAMDIHQRVTSRTGFCVPVIITDTQGRPWRKGAVNLAIGVAGMSPFTRNAGKKDLYGRDLQSSLVCIADELAAAAELVMGQANEGIPVVIIRGMEVECVEGTATQIIRSNEEDLFSHLRQ